MRSKICSLVAAAAVAIFVINHVDAFSFGPFGSNRQTQHRQKQRYQPASTIGKEDDSQRSKDESVSPLTARSMARTDRQGEIQRRLRDAVPVDHPFANWKKSVAAMGLVVSMLSNMFVPLSALPNTVAWAETAASVGRTYDGFADYAKENQMEQSDVACFINECGAQTKALFANPRGIKGVSCLGRCKGEQSCATQCFAAYGSDSLNDWLSCTIEDHGCVKVPKNVDNSAEGLGYETAVRAFDPSSLIGTWYKTDGLNPNYDLFDCQTNIFQASDPTSRELDMGIFFRISRPDQAGGGYWENALTEHMVVDAPASVSSSSSIMTASATKAAPLGTQIAAAAGMNVVDDSINNEDVLAATASRTMHTSGKMYGLQFSENWYILAESNGQSNIPPFKLVAYKGHTLQGNYEGAFVYAKEPILPEAAKPAIRQAAAKAGLDFDQFTRIDNTCPSGLVLNDAEAGTGTTTTDWLDLVVGEGGIIDWISPGWRGEYKQKAS